MAVTNISSYDTSATNVINQKISKLKNSSKNKTYTSLSEYTKLTQSKKDKYVQSYKEKFESQTNKGKLSVDELKEDLKKEFSDLSFLSFEPKSLVDSKYYCYIDDDNLKKMARNPEYRSEIYALLQRETETINNEIKYNSNSQVVKSSLNSCIISIKQDNDLSEGIRYNARLKFTDSFYGKKSQKTIKLAHEVTRNTESSIKNSELKAFLSKISSKQRTEKISNNTNNNIDSDNTSESNNDADLVQTDIFGSIFNVTV